jgi:Transmembrane family 220, helix
MRYLNGSLCVLMTLFTIVQYNDPDAPLWMLIYGLAAIWAGLAAYDPGAVAHHHWLLGLLGLNILAVGAGAIYMWPLEVTTWWENEEVREGLGLMITASSLLVVAFALWRSRHLGIPHFAH